MVESERVVACKAAVEEAQEALRSLQAHQNIDITQLAAMRNVLAQGTVPLTIPTIQASMPTVTPEENRAEFDRILAMLERVKLAQ